MTSNNGQKCGNCRYFIANPQDLRQGFCRSKPPTVFVLPMQGPAGQQGVNFVGQWPPVRDETWCGEWQSRSLQ